MRKIKRIKLVSKMIIMVLVVIMFSLIFNYSVNAAVKYYATDIKYSFSQDYIYGFKFYENTGPVKEKLTDNAEIYVAQSANGYLSNGTDRNGNDIMIKCFDILNQPNVYCIEHGRKLGMGYFKVSKEYDVKDPILAYILYSDTNTNYESDYKKGDTQNALWHYVYSGGNDNDQLNARNSENWEKEVGLYTKAEEYEERVTTKPVIDELSYDETNKQATIKVSNFTYYDIYIGGEKKYSNVKTSEKVIDLSSYNGNINVKVKAYVSHDTYNVKYRILTKGDKQRLLVVTYKGADTNNLDTEKSIDVTVVNETNISLQKYIIKLNEVAISGRKNRKANNSSTHGISEYNSSSGTNKYSDPVYIEAGDTVTYKISVYNNSDYETTNISVKDTLPSNIEKYKVNDGDWINTNLSSYTHTISKLAGAGTTDFTVTVKFTYNKDIIGTKIENKAEISSTTPENKTDYRTEDSDYIIMKGYAISLEKYITNVEGTNVSDRNNKQKYCKKTNTTFTFDDDSNTNNTYKYDNPVNLEIGDEVTYKIIISNNGDTTVKIDTIEDNMDANFYNISCTGSDGAVWNYSNGTFNSKSLKTIYGGKTYTLTVKANVNIPFDNTDNEQIIPNTAKIDVIKNKNSISVTDTTLNNNEDSDYVKTKIYKVSLEKFITKVESKDETKVYSNRAYSTDEYKNRDEYRVWKEDNKVRVEYGDKVTFTIRLKNEGTTKVKISNIKDIFTYINDINSGYRLVYDSTYGIRGNGGGNISGSPGSYTINFSNPILLNPNNYTDITIRFKVEIDLAKTDKELDLENYAKIVNIKNKNNILIKDANGDGDNWDEDYVKTKIYKVSLEKYISSTRTGKELPDTTDWKELYNYLKINGTDKYTAVRDKYSKIASVAQIESKIGISRNDINDSITEEEYRKYDLNGDKEVTLDDLKIFNYYKNKENIEELEEKIRNYDEYYNKYDINNDGKVTREDVSLYDRYNSKKDTGFYARIADIEAYIKCDLNNDGVVTDDDLDIYERYVYDFNKDGIINENDLYELYLQKNIKNNKSKDEVLNLLKIKKFMDEFDLTSKQEVETEISKYIEYDINEDGIVDDQDDAIKGSFSNYKSLVDAITNKEEIEDIIKRYDFNNDNNFSEQDIDMYEYLVENFDLESYELGKQEEVISEVRKIVYSKYDIDNDGKITIEDYINSTDEDQKDTILEIITAMGYYDYDCYSNHDMNNDGRITIEDYINSTDEDQKNTILEILGLDIYIYECYNNYDMNNDGKITIEDYIDDETDEDQKNTILEILEIEEYVNNTVYEQSYNCYSNYDIDNDGKITKADYKQNADEEQKDTILEILGLNHDTEQEEIYECYNDYDINKDGKITIEDYMNSTDEDQKNTILEILGLSHQEEYEKNIDINSYIYRYYESENYKLTLELIHNLQQCSLDRIKTELEFTTEKEREIKNKYDFNKDERIDNTDINIFNIIKHSNKTELINIINEITNYDITGDGLVDNQDKIIYAETIENFSDEGLTFEAIKELEDEGKLERYKIGINNLNNNHQDGNETDPAYDRNNNKSYIDEIESLNKYDQYKDIIIKFKYIYDNFNLLDSDLNGTINNEDKMYFKYLDAQFTTEVNTDYYNKVDLYDINDDGKVDVKDIETVNEKFDYEIIYISQDLENFYIYVKESNTDKVTILEDIISKEISVITSDLARLDAQLNEYTTIDEEINYTDIDKQRNVGLTNLDANEDGKITQSDIDYINLEDIDSDMIEKINNIENNRENFEFYINYDSKDKVEASLDSYNYSEVNIEEGKKNEIEELISAKFYTLIEFNKKAIGMTSDTFTNLDLNCDKIINDTDKEIYNGCQYIISNNIENDISKYFTETNDKGRDGKQIYCEETDTTFISDNDPNTKNSYKYDNAVFVNKGDIVEYTIKVRNDGDTKVIIQEIKDRWVAGLNGTTAQEVVKNDLVGAILEKGNSITFKIELEVTANNMSLEKYENNAWILDNIIKNKNGEDVLDSTKNDNSDSDYIQLGPNEEHDLRIEGFVWNDKAFTKDLNTYNGYYDSELENYLEATVYLYRDGVQYPIASKQTTNGYYTFKASDILANIVPNEWERHIKGPYDSGTKRWEGSYYSYYVVFEYDGITYTSTPDFYKPVDINEPEGRYSNAREKLSREETFDGRISKDRTAFNNDFSTIHNKKGISYNTKNETGYIPQSNHVYNSSMDMQSSTNKFTLSNNDAWISKLKHVDIGLRGRDIFDLELISAVDQIKITVNNEQGVYKDTNTAEFRTSDSLASGIAKEDMATAVSEKTNTYLNNEERRVRESDYNVDTSKGYTEGQGISHVEVRYKITVQNTSITKGTATKITNYYDSNYTFVGAYSTPEDAENYVKELTSNNVTGDKYGYVTIDNANGNMLNPYDGKMEIYIVYTLNNPAENLKNISKDNPFVTLNMAEIIEYKTEAKDAANEATRGLIDKDSAPGSVNREQVRLTTTEGRNTQTINGNPTTVEYYFNKLTNANIKNEDYLKILKYEDDTYATPTIFKAAIDDNGTPDNPDDDPDDPYIKRTITGTVFEDYTTIIGDEDEDIRLKTGDGVQNTTDNVEPGIKGITVRLYEVTSDGNKLRDTAETNEKGEYIFEGYLPGNYIVKYDYGDTNNTFLLDNAPNTKSYNGEDFQSTNNTGKAGGQEYDWIKTLSNEPNYWYVYNENDGISTATDVVDTRQTVSTNVTSFTDSQMTVLNNARDGMSENDAKVGDVTVESIRNATKMEATTNSMHLTMEKTVDVVNGEGVQNEAFKDYVVGNMNFGIAEVPVTTIDMQKHVHSFTITDSTGSNILAGARVDTDNTSVVVNASKISVNRLDTVINVLSKNLGISKDKVRETINYDQNKLQDINITIAQNVKEENKNSLKDDMTKYSLAREIKILYGWKVTAGAVKAYPGASTINVELEDDKLQGAKLEITYEVSANIYAEKNFNNEAVTVPTIEGMVDYIDNDLSYDANKKTTQGNNSNYWSVTTYENVQGLFEGQGNGTVDSEGTNYSTIVSANEGSEILQEKCGEGTVYITLEKVLSSPDSTLADIITNSIDSYEYSNTIEITKLNYENQTGTEDTGDSGNTGGSDGTTNPEGEDKFIFTDRVRTPDRFIIVPGMSHDYESAETIVIIPPLGDSSIHTVYYIIAAISLVVVVAGVIGIKKFVVKK